MKFCIVSLITQSLKVGCPVSALRAHRLIKNASRVTNGNEIRRVFPLGKYAFKYGGGDLSTFSVSRFMEAIDKVADRNRMKLPVDEPDLGLYPNRPYIV